MKKIKIIERAQLNFHPEQVMDSEDLSQLKGGLCNYNDFNINGTCVCVRSCFLRVGKAPSTTPAAPVCPSYIW